MTGRPTTILDALQEPFRRFLAALATRRCIRLLERSDAARERGNRAAAEWWMVPATAMLPGPGACEAIGVQLYAVNVVWPLEQPTIEVRQRPQPW